MDRSRSHRDREGEASRDRSALDRRSPDRHRVERRRTPDRRRERDRDRTPDRHRPLTPDRNRFVLCFINASFLITCKATAVCNVWHRLLTIAAVPKSTRPRAFSGMVI